MNGGFLAQWTLPDHPWLSQDWLRQYVEITGPTMRDMEQNAHHPLVRQVLPPPVAATLAQLWTQRHELLGLLDALPRTFCHLDAYRRNLFIRQQTQGTDEVVAIDWGYAGIAALGEEIGVLVAATLFLGEVPARDAHELEQSVFFGYIDGLRDAGWDGDPAQVRTGYVASTALRYGVGVVHVQLFYLLDERNHPRMERIMGMPLADIIVLFHAVNAWVAELGEEALRTLTRARLP